MDPLNTLEALRLLTALHGAPPGPKLLTPRAEVEAAMAAWVCAARQVALQRRSVSLGAVASFLGIPSHAPEQCRVEGPAEGNQEDAVGASPPTPGVRYFRAHRNLLEQSLTASLRTRHRSRRNGGGSGGGEGGIMSMAPLACSWPEEAAVAELWLPLWHAGNVAAAALLQECGAAHDDASVPGDPKTAWARRQYLLVTETLGLLGVVERQDPARRPTRHAAPTRPLVVTAQRSVLAAHGAALIAASADTMRITAEVHDISTVAGAVSSVLDAAGASHLDGRHTASLHSAAFAPLLLATRDATAPALPPATSSTAAADSTTTSTASALSFFDACAALFHADSRAASWCSLANGSEISDAFVTVRIPPDATCHADFRESVDRTLRFIANHLRIAIEQHAAGSGAFYAIIPLLNDAALALSHLHVSWQPLARSQRCGPAAGSGDHCGPPTIPLPAPSHAPLAALLGPTAVECATYIACLIGDGVTGVFTAVERIIRTAFTDYTRAGDAEACPAARAATGTSSAKGAQAAFTSAHASGALMTVLCSALQPLVAVGAALARGGGGGGGDGATSIFPPLWHRAVELTAVSLRDTAALSCAQAAAAASARAVARVEMQVAADRALLRRFVLKHPLLAPNENWSSLQLLLDALV